MKASFSFDSTTINVSGFAIVKDGDSRLSSCMRSLARRTGLDICGGPCSAGYNPGSGSTFYNLTLGRRIRNSNGTFNVEASGTLTIHR